MAENAVITRTRTNAREIVVDNKRVSVLEDDSGVGLSSVSEEFPAPEKTKHKQKLASSSSCKRKCIDQHLMVKVTI